MLRAFWGVATRARAVPSLAVWFAPPATKMCSGLRASMSCQSDVNGAAVTAAVGCEAAWNIVE